MKLQYIFIDSPFNVILKQFRMIFLKTEINLKKQKKMLQNYDAGSDWVDKRPLRAAEMTENLSNKLEWNGKNSKIPIACLANLHVSSEKQDGKWRDCRSFK